MKVTLKANHTDSETRYAAGSEINVRPIDALWLKAQDKIKEPLSAISAEIKKLDVKGQDAHRDALDRAAAAEATRKADQSADTATK